MFDRFKSEKAKKVEITVSNRTVLRILLLSVGIVIGVTAVEQASHALLLLFLALFLTLALNGPVHWLAKRMGGSRAAATGVSFFILLVIFGAFLASIVPPLVRQTSNFISIAPDLVENARDENSGLGEFIRRYNLEDQADKISGDLSNRLGSLGGSAFSTASRIGGNVFSVITVLVLTFMMLVEGPNWLRFFRQLVPKHRRKHTDKLLADMYKVVRGYVNGQVILAATAALLILVPLFILDISYPVALMVIVFFCGLIPMVGHYIGAAIVTVVALFTSPWDALIILAYYILYQQIENYVIQPTVQANSTNMSPLLVFSSVIIGVSFGGLLGGLVAIPVAGCMRVLALDYLKSRHYLESGAEEAYEKAVEGPA